MKILIAVLLSLTLSGCAHWDQLEPAEKVAVGVGGALIVSALIIRNGQQVNNFNCISTRSLDTGCGGRFER